MDTEEAEKRQDKAQKRGAKVLEGVQWLMPREYLHGHGCLAPENRAKGQTRGIVLWSGEGDEVW